MIKNTTAFAGAALIATLAAAGTVGAQNQGPPPRVQAVLVMNEFAEAIPVVVQAPERTAFTLRLGGGHTNDDGPAGHSLNNSAELPAGKRFVVESVALHGKVAADGWPDATLGFKMGADRRYVQLSIANRDVAPDGWLHFDSSYRILFFMDSGSAIHLRVIDHLWGPQRSNDLIYAELLLTGYLVDLPEEE